MEKNSKEECNLEPEKLIKDIQEKDSKNLYLLKEVNLILDMISYLQDKEFPITNKIVIVKYLFKCITNIPINVDILFNQNLNNKSIYHIIISQYITNYENKNII